ncbi:MAG: glycosyltransferase [Treponema sp.]|nr:glycosyltransferase [Candidatus Treponema merdequi]
MKTLCLIADFEHSGGIRTYFKQLINYFSHNYKQLKIEKLYIFLWQSQNDNEIQTLLKACPVFVPVVLPRIFQFTIISKVFRKLHLLDWYESVFEKLTVNKMLKFKPDAMIFSIGNGTKYFYALTKNIPCLFISHTLMQQSPVIKNYRKKIYKKILKNVNPKSRVCSVSHIGKTLYEKFLPVPSGCNLYAVLTNHAGSLNDKIKKTKHSNITILTLGLLASFKNPDLWLSVAKKITDRCKTENEEIPDFIWAGEGTYFNRLTEEARNYTNIKFIGFQNDTSSLYAGSDIYVQPSTTENCCLSVIEAMKFSLPCVVSNVGGLPEQIENDRNGYLCASGNEKEFFDSIVKLIKNKTKRTSFGREARLTFENTYSQEIWNKSFSSLINNLIK